MQPKLDKHSKELIDHLERLFEGRLMTAEELKIYREQVLFRQAWKTVGSAAKRFVISLAAVLVAIGAIYNLIPWVGAGK